MVRDEVVGVLDCQSDHVDHFDSETIDLLTLFSTQASIALQNARLYSLEQQRARQLQAINAIAQQTTAVLDLEELLSQGLPADSGCVSAYRTSRFSCARITTWCCGRITERSRPRIPQGGRFPANTEPWAGILGQRNCTAMERDLSERSRRHEVLRRIRLTHVHSPGFVRTDSGSVSRWTALRRMPSATAICSRWNRWPTFAPRPFRMHTMSSA